MRTDLTIYYNSLRLALQELITQYNKYVGIKLAKLVEHIDAALFPCLINKTNYFYLVTAADIKQMNFGKNRNEKIIKLNKKTTIVIITL